MVVSYLFDCLRLFSSPLGGHLLLDGLLFGLLSRGLLLGSHSSGLVGSSSLLLSLLLGLLELLHGGLFGGLVGCSLNGHLCVLFGLFLLVVIFAAVVDLDDVDAFLGAFFGGSLCSFTNNGIQVGAVI